MLEELNELAKEASKQAVETNKALEDLRRVNYKLLADKWRVRLKLRAIEARHKELGRELSTEKELIKELQKELEKERLSLERAIERTFFLQQESHQKNTEFGEMQHLLHVKESELVEAKLDIQKLKSEHASLQLVLENKDLQLINARKNLGDEVNQEVA
ncbi:hypothetical protein D5086_031534 [Populus alba]|uniref:Uncharacterized protein n=2 Tax=Populus alba TaxID=43335 RepID=A0A4U5QLH3_POPAL|nr:hypothetical protein D5086_0000076910 [Populus alba]